MKVMNIFNELSIWQCRVLYLVTIISMPRYYYLLDVPSIIMVLGTASDPYKMPQGSVTFDNYQLLYTYESWLSIVL